MYWCIRTEDKLLADSSITSTRCGCAPDAFDVWQDRALRQLGFAELARHSFCGGKHHILVHLGRAAGYAAQAHACERVCTCASAMVTRLSGHASRNCRDS